MVRTSAKNFTTTLRLIETTQPAGTWYFSFTIQMHLFQTKPHYKDRLP